MNERFNFLCTFLLSVFLVVVSNCAYSQDLNGYVLDLETNSAIAFANVGIVSHDLGTISNREGYFQLPIAEISGQVTIRISCIGYQARELSLNELETESKIYLSPKDYAIDEVTVRPEGKVKSKGKEKTGKILAVGSRIVQPGAELGVLIKNNHKVKIDGMGLYNPFSKMKDSLTIRVNIYAAKNRMPEQNLLSENILVDLLIDNGINLVDLSNYNIWLEDDFIISYELIDLNKNTLGPQIGGSFSGPKAFFREASQGDWKTFPMNASVGISVYYRNSK